MIETFESFCQQVSSFHALSPTEKILHAAWYLHSKKGKQFFGTADVNDCFKSIHAAPPQTSVYLRRLAEKKPPAFLKSKNGYCMEGNLRRLFNEKYTQNSDTIAVSSLLSELLTKLRDPAESVFLTETLKCYSVSAFRAAIVMAWNLTYDHLESYVLSDQERVDNFNKSLAIKYPKRQDNLVDRDSFSAFKEFEVIETLIHAKLVSKNVGEILKEKLKKRNAAAHPSSVAISRA